MKSYKEMADNVFSRIAEEKTMEIKKHHNRVYMASTMAVFGLVLLIGAGAWLKGQMSVGEPGPVQGSEPETGETKIEQVEYREVIFLNRIHDGYAYDMDMYGYTGIHDPYTLVLDEEVDPDALYAYYVEGFNVGEEIAVRKMLHEEGFLLIKDHPESGLVIAGKMEDFKRVFLVREPYRGFYLGAFAATRPDMVEVLKAYCGDGIYYETMNSYNWFNAHFEDLIPFLGTDRDRVTLEVAVEPLWDEKKEELPVIDAELQRCINMAQWCGLYPGLCVPDAMGVFANGFSFNTICYESMTRNDLDDIYAIVIRPGEKLGEYSTVRMQALEVQLKEQGIPTLLHWNQQREIYECYIFVTGREIENIQLDNFEDFGADHALKPGWIVLYENDTD